MSVSTLGIIMRTITMEKKIDFPGNRSLANANDAMEDRNSIPAVPSTPTKTVLNIQR